MHLHGTEGPGPTQQEHRDPARRRAARKRRLSAPTRQRVLDKPLEQGIHLIGPGIFVYAYQLTP